MGVLSGRFRHISIALCLPLIGLMQAGCRSWIRPGTDIPQSLDTMPPFYRESAVLLPGADYHLAIVRPGPAIRGYSQDVLCEEPSPDWAIAFGTAFAGAASGGASGGPSGSVSGNANTTEAITALAGRTAGVVALRDGLYSACQAYANQLIGKDAYALILSQYGNLLVALASGGGGGAASATPASSTPPGVSVAVSTGGASDSAKPSGTPSGSNAPGGGNSEVPIMQQEAVQAVLVACISYNDLSIPHAVNRLLDSYCRLFMDALGQALPSLLKPAGATSQPSSGSKPAAIHKVTSSDAVKDLQQVLLQDGDYQGPINGVYSPATIAAFKIYVKKHPEQVPAR